ncbi:MAG TPA: Ig-like domain-containing protein [Roseiflexaceae bacterium]|nr:Ig-like domain-containing protein [Roseiflexaceae bacterium]
MIALPTPHARSLGRSLPAMLALLLALTSLLALRASSVPHLPLPAAMPTAADLSKMPLAFVPNAGQTDPRVRFQADGMGGTLFFTPEELVLVLPAGERRTAVAGLRFEGANPAPEIRSADKLPGVLNIIEGNDPGKWHIGLPNYGSITYGQLYQGIDLHYAGTDGRLKGTYLVAAGRDPGVIRWRYTGASDVRVDSTGDLHISIPGTDAPLIERAPIAWQEIDGRNVPVNVRFAVQADSSVGFALGGYDAAYPLVIDPTLEYSTYLGGSGIDRVQGISVDLASGDVFVTGETSSLVFPGSPANVGTTGPGSFPNIFVVRVGATGASTIYRTLIGGTDTDIATAIAVEGGVANVVGQTLSNNLPIAGTPYQATNGGSSDMFALALDGAGALTYSTYIGGPSSDAARDVVARGNSLFIVGETNGAFPNSTAPAGGTDAIVLRIDKTAGPAVQYVTRLGGLFNDAGRAIILDTPGNAYVTGITGSNGASPQGFPTVGTPFQPNSGGSEDAFITQLNAAGTPAYSSYLGGSNIDEGLGIEVDPAGGVVYVTGRTLSPNFPSVGSDQLQAQDAFVTKINITTNQVGYSRLLGSPGVDLANAIALDNTGAAYVVGQTSSPDFFALNPLPEMATRGGNIDAFVTRYDRNGIPSYSTRLGGGLNDIATDVATVQTPQGAKVYAGGYTTSTDFPPTVPPSPIQPSLGGNDDGFVVRISNTRPIVDLNDNNPGNGIDFGVTWTEAGTTGTPNPTTVVVGPGLTVIDTDNPTLAYAEVRFVASTATGDTAIAPPNGLFEGLFTVPPGGSSITSVYYPITGTLRLTGGSSIADYQNALRTLTYANTSETPNTSPRLLAVEINDGIDRNQPLAFITINVVASNDPPLLTVPSPVVVAEEGTIGLTGITVSDVDAAGANLQVTLTVPSVAGTLTATGSGGATVTGTGTNSLQITGTITDTNATLASLSFTGALDYNSNAGISTPNNPAVLSILVNDQGNTGVGGPKTAEGTLNITVDPINDAPVGPTTPPTIAPIEDGPLTVFVWAGSPAPNLGVTDTKDRNPPAAPGGVPLLPLQSITVTTPPANGTISAIDVNAGSFAYSPNAQFNGTDTFTLQICDRGTPPTTSACLSQVVNVTITPVNDAPSFTGGGNVPTPPALLLEDAGAQTIAGWATGISAGPADEAGQTLTFEVTNNTNPTLFSVQPSVNPANGDLTFTTAPDANGSASITIVLRDNGGTANGGVDVSLPYSFTITVTPVNDPPAFDRGQDVTVAEDSPAYSAPWAGNIRTGPADEAGQTVTFNITNNTNPTLFSAGPAIAPNGTLSFTPAANANGFADITVVLQDNGGTANGGVDTSSPPVTFRITITAINDPPSFTKGPDVNLNEDNGPFTQANWATAISAGPADEAGQTLTFNITGNSNPGLFSAGPAIDPTGQLTFTPAPNAFGTATITVTLSDNGGGTNTSAPQSFVVTINPVNDVPTFDPGPNVTVPEDSPRYSQPWATNISPGAPNEADQLLSFEITNNTNPALFSGTVVISPNGTLNFTPAPNAVGVATITVRLRDNGGTANGGVDVSPTVDFTITISPVNDPPSFTPGGNVVTNEDTPFSEAWASDISPGPGETGSVTFNVTVTNPALFATQPTIAPDGTLSFTPAPNEYGVVTATVTLSDDGGATTAPPVTFTITVESVNDGPPVTQPDAATVAEDGSVIVEVAANDSDPADAPRGGINPLTVSIGTQPANGTAVVDVATGRVTYTPNPDFNGTDTFTYTICDIEPNPANVLCTPGTVVTITVTASNDPPTATPDTVSVAEDSGANPIDVLANDSSAPDAGETLTVIGVTPASNGLVTLVSGVISYTPNPNYFGPDAFTYTISDGNGGTATAAVTVNVTSVNDLPTGVDDRADVGLNAPRVITVLQNDIIAPDANERLRVTRIITPALNGTAVLNNGGADVLYTPNNGYIGPDSFSYEVCDDGSSGPPGPLCSTATVTLNVGKISTFLPVVLKPKLPDLQVQMSVSTGQIIWQEPAVITLVVTNRGNAPATNFWVDLYLNPSEPPVVPNKPWNEVCTLDPCYGVAWFVSQTVEPGQSITLTTTPQSYFRENTRWVGFLPRGTMDVYAYVDSWNRDASGNAISPFGAVYETSEANNRAELHYVPQANGVGEGRGAPAMDLRTVEPRVLPLPQRSLNPQQ